jgi:hypothetical protein
VNDDRRAVARERRLVTRLVDRADRQQIGRGDRRRDRLGERRIGVGGARRGDEQDFRCVRERAGEGVLLEIEVLSRDRLAIVGRLEVVLTPLFFSSASGNVILPFGNSRE